MQAEGHRSARGARGEELVRLVQLLVTEGGKVGGAFAARHGLHPTDVDALVHVLVAQQRGAPLTPGGLGADLGLTSGAVTSVVDRLERAGHVVRTRDAVDRRRVLLHHSDDGLALAEQFFGPLGARTDAVLAGFTDDELDVVARFLAGMGAALAEHRRTLGGPER